MSVPKNPGLLEEGEEEESYGTSESMDPELYRATTKGDILEFIKAMEHGTLERQYHSSAGCVQLGPQKNTVLHIATSCGHYEIVKLLCNDLPFYVAEKNSKGDTPLHIAARAGDSLLVTLLINCDLREGALELENEERNTALHEALGHRHRKVARILIDRNRSAWYSVNKEGKSVLYLAAEAGFVGLVKLLMENPAGICRVEGRIRNKSPVHAAILGKHIDVLKMLWEKDQSSFNLRCDEEGRNALHFSASLGFLEGVKFLLSNFCAAAYQRDIYGLFPIHTASSEGHVDIIQGMLQHCPDSRELLTLQGQNIFHVTAKSGNDKAVSSMLKMPELEKLLNEKDNEGNTPLHVATICGHPRIVRALTWDERVDLELVNNNGLTALDIAEEFMETRASFRKRLTWMALRVAGAPQSPHTNISRQTSSAGQNPELENYKDKANVVLLVATLVATVTFTAGFTVPGGYNNSDPDQGIATMLAKVKFQEFMICDTIAMYSSIIVTVTLICAQLGDLSSMHVALKLAVPLLAIAVAMMSIAFMAGLYVVVNTVSWLGNVILVMGSNVVIVLAALFVPLCFLGSSNYHIFRRLSYFPFRLLLYAFGSYTERDEIED
ncbi:protein ACCELERATED CELL DEATH 6-like isoform X1 [Rhododendron vialii]|uniref:protein ACCELERATED CELL DEATH 6-like isoform X1 n=1 Tax=Rhododendron vialii TaxID=182163 RepID=UPI00265F3A42|nr:protein ACCELERATED CELL DEATH 6-like isoform X1 [Rhododendron vialii]